MLIYVANPLYDAVFKYMMEDERIAKTFAFCTLAENGDCCRNATSRVS